MEEFTYGIHKRRFHHIITCGRFIEEVGVIMIGCYFIQLTKTMLERQKGFIHTHKTIFATMVFELWYKKKHCSFSFTLFFRYCYVVKFYTNFLVKMKGNINKDMAKRMKRKESLDLELGSSHLALKID